MAALLTRARQACTGRVYRHVICPTVGCDPDWLAQIMFGYVQPRCRHCRRIIP